MRCKPDGQICNGGFSQRKKFTVGRPEIATEDSCGMEEVDSVRRVVDAMCAGIGRKVALVANYNGFRIDEALSNAYFAMVEGLHAGHYSQATRYAASAFMRAKLGGALSTRRCLRVRGKRWRFWVGRMREGKTNSCAKLVAVL